MIALVDYGAGNLTSVRKAFHALGADLFTPAAPDDLERARAIVVPGVGHFGATSALDAGWRDRLAALVAAGTPLLGICLGMQWLFDGSEEAPGAPGLGVLAGCCMLLRPAADGGAEARLKVPHVGWNTLQRTRPSSLLNGVAEGAQAYFTHSYVAPVTGDTVATTTYGRTFATVVERGNVCGVQFHPEKSGEVGLRILRNFLDAPDRTTGTR